MKLRRNRNGRRLDPGWLLAGLALSLVIFLFAISRPSKVPAPIELPTPTFQSVGLGRPDATVAQVHVGEFIQIDLHPGPDDRYGLVFAQPSRIPSILEQTSIASQPPLLRGASPGTATVTVLLEPHCPEVGACQEYRRTLGAARITVVP